MMITEFADEPNPEYEYPDLPQDLDEIVELFQEQVNRHLYNFTIANLESVDTAYASGQIDYHASHYEQMAHVEWLYFADWMQARHFDADAIKSVCERVKWFDPEVAEWFENRTPPERMPKPKNDG